MCACSGCEIEAQHAVRGDDCCYSPALCVAPAQKKNKTSTPLSTIALFPLDPFTDRLERLVKMVQEVRENTLAQIVVVEGAGTERENAGRQNHLQQQPQPRLPHSVSRPLRRSGCQEPRSGGRGARAAAQGWIGAAAASAAHRGAAAAAAAFWLCPAPLASRTRGDKL